MATRLKFEVFDVYDRMESKVGIVAAQLWHCASCCDFCTVDVPNRPGTLPGDGAHSCPR